MRRARGGSHRGRGNLRRLSGAAAPVLAAAALLARPAHALVWPDVAERVERDLQAADPATRRSAARELAELGPGRGAPLALQALGDPDDDVKLTAADAAIRLHAEGATDAVAPWLNAQDTRLRRKACEVALALPSPRVVSLLARTLGDPDADVRVAAANALGHEPAADAVPPLLGRLDDAAPSVRVQIISSLARLGDTHAVVPLVGKVQDSSAEVRTAVARALGELGDPRASSALVLALRDQTTDVKRDALTALGRIRAADAVDAIAPFAEDRVAALRLAALEALGRISTPDALRILIQELGTSDDVVGSLERTAVRDALVLAGGRAVAPLHAVLAGSGPPQATASAAWVLGALHATGEATTIVAAMRRGTLSTAAAMHALAGAGSSAEVPVVLEFVDDPNPAVRDEALEAAIALLDPVHPDGRAVEPLTAALRDARPSAAQRIELTALLGRTGAARAAPLLVELAQTREPELRLAAIDALGTLGPTGATGADDTLIDALGSADARVRLHAAEALAQAGGARARDALTAQLDGGDEVDRAAVLTGLGGILSRVPSDAAIERLRKALELAAGPERDAIVEAFGQARTPSATRALAEVAKSAEAFDRRVVAEVLAAHAGDGVAVSLARALLDDADASVRAQAVWALGTVGDASDEANLVTLARSSHIDAATNAAAALGRIAARAHAPDIAGRTLCPLVADAHASVRANAFAALALSGARCQDGSPARHALTDDPSEDVRASAARAVARGATADDTRTLERCARTDPSGTVASLCRDRPASPPGTRPVVIFVEADRASTPRPGAAYAVLFADGLERAGATDRRGALFDPAAPRGDASLRRPTGLDR